MRIEIHLWLNALGFNNLKYFKQSFSCISAILFLKLSQSIHFYICSYTENLYLYV